MDFQYSFNTIGCDRAGFCWRIGASDLPIVEVSTDDGRTWTTELSMTRKEAEDAAAGVEAGCGDDPSTRLVDLAVLALPDGTEVAVAAQHGGVLLRSPSGEWRRVSHQNLQAMRAPEVKETPAGPIGRSATNCHRVTPRPGRRAPRRLPTGCRAPRPPVALSRRTRRTGRRPATTSAPDEPTQSGPQQVEPERHALDGQYLDSGETRVACVAPDDVGADHGAGGGGARLGHARGQAVQHAVAVVAPFLLVGRPGEGVIARLVGDQDDTVRVQGLRAARSASTGRARSWSISNIVARS